MLASFRKAPGRPHLVRASDFTRIASVGSIDTTTVGTHNLLVVPTGVLVVVVEAYIRCVSAANVATPATAGIGVAAGEDDIFASQLLVGLTTAGYLFRIPPGGSGVIASGGDVVKLGVDVAATGASVSQIVQVELFGYQV
ncbi:MAG: hypothetical protein AB7L09_03420 [Nitrospira sp.]